MTIALESPDQTEVIALIAELDAYQDTLYPPQSRHYMDLDSMHRVIGFARYRTFLGTANRLRNKNSHSDSRTQSRMAAVG
jgi:hypothetical protein